MAPKISIMEALQNLADQEGEGLKTERGEFVMDAAMSAVVKTLADELGGLGARSRVVRRLIQKGAKAELAERQARTQTPAGVDPVEAAKEAEREKRRERDRRRREALAQGTPAA